ncbi:MAG: ABC transporter substrate-binding protein [Desulfuromonadales bacterium]|nr:ABC transporter substrate-binding protein [Desulfuromonadales bacterium]
MRCFKILILISCWLSLCVLPAYSAASPKAQVQATVDQVIDVLRDKQLQGEPRRQTLSRMIRARFNFNIMSQRTLGKYWRTATEAEQERFVSLFSELLEASYIGRIEDYSDETVSYGEEKIEENRADVATTVHSGNTHIPIDYRLVLKGDDWFVYDVVIEEVSLIRNYRSTYGEIVRKENFSGLFKRMEEKIAELRQSSGETTGQ